MQERVPIIKEKNHLMEIEPSPKSDLKADMIFKTALINIHRFKGKDGHVSVKETVRISKLKF